MRSEKWAIFLILTFILIIASFNVIGSLTMLVIEKKHDIKILHSMGASQKAIRAIFLLEGIMISIGGALVGLVLGGLISWLQMRFGIVGIQADGAFIIDAYPVFVKLMDLLLVSVTVFGIGLLAALFLVRNISLLSHEMK
jgi:lipoprotein-releasing system permease protein